jgi:tetratricopeptide (TPR) repeat protein
MRYYPGLVKQSGYVHPDEMTIPLLFFTQGNFTLEEQARYLTSKDSEGPNVLNAWTHGDLLTVHDMALIHLEHSSMFQRNEDLWKTYDVHKNADYSRADGMVGYAWVCRYTLNFLDAYLKHDSVAMAFLKKTPAENGVPPHLLATSFRPAKGTPASFEAFRSQVGQKGFDQAAAIYSAMQKEKPDFKLDEASLQSWASELVVQDHLPEAIVILRLAVQIYSASSDDQESLGEAYMKNRQNQLATDAFNQALKLDPDNQDAKDKLKELRSTAITAK